MPLVQDVKSVRPRNSYRDFCNIRNVFLYTESKRNEFIAFKQWSARLSEFSHERKSNIPKNLSEKYFKICGLLLEYVNLFTQQT